MMLFTNLYQNHSRVFFRPFLTSAEVSKSYNNHIRRYWANKIFGYNIDEIIRLTEMTGHSFERKFYGACNRRLKRARGCSGMIFVPIDRIIASKIAIIRLWAHAVWSPNRTLIFNITYRVLKRDNQMIMYIYINMCKVYIRHIYFVHIFYICNKVW